MSSLEFVYCSVRGRYNPSLVILIERMSVRLARDFPDNRHEQGHSRQRNDHKFSSPTD
ncbi:hypothetical protein [Adhaeribacter arboris]|uniref:hypothetical protein n=1 Tax=Adhaeribacter arboris TaxID=2072846 RepID=UPI001304B573|nr:hypothetical protein [Adhaeribacter arboris]